MAQKKGRIDDSGMKKEVKAFIKKAGNDNNKKKATQKTIDKYVKSVAKKK